MIQTWIDLIIYRNHAFSDQVRIAIKNNDLAKELPEDKFFIKQLSNLRAKPSYINLYLKNLTQNLELLQDMVHKMD